MSVSVIAKFVAIVSLCSPFLLATPAAAQRVVQRYEAYPQQRSSGNHGGGFLESLFSGGQPSPETGVDRQTGQSSCGTPRSGFRRDGGGLSACCGECLREQQLSGKSRQRSLVTTSCRE